MALQQTIDQARPANFAGVLARTGEALAKLHAQHADGTLPLLRLPEKRDDIAAILGYAALLRDGTTDVIFLGTGGSSLGGQALAQLAGYAVPGVGALRDPPRIHFMDNLDPQSYGALLQRLPLKTSRFVAVSKSGGTGETLMQTIAALDAVKAARLDPHAHFLLPAAVCGLDIGAIRAGAGDALAPVLGGKPPAEVPAAVGAALAASLGSHKTISVMMAYADRLALFTKWYVQLWAESLGKDGKGTTPIGALGPVDQHSQLQLYMAGPRDKLFTVITGTPAGKGPRMTAELSKLCGEPDFTGKTIGDLVAAQGRATAETLAKNGCPVRTIHLPQLDERHLGELLMHFMLETIVAAHLIGVDPFDQPAVEEGKVLAKKYLSGAS
jgi:glucose-6-phosphate isomerase